LYQTNICEIGKKYKFTFDVTESSGVPQCVSLFNIWFDSSSLAVGTYSIIHTAANTSGIRFRCKTGGTGSFAIDNVSVKEYLGQEVVPNSGCGSWLFEPQSTNLVTQSETYGSGTFFSGTSGSTIDNTTSISPSGEANATQITSTGAGKIQSIAITTLSQNTDYAFSFYAKNVDATEVKSRVLAIGGSGGSGLNTVSYINEISTENWSRITHNFNTGTHTTFYLYMSNELNSGGTIQLWGAQLEQQSYATSYIPTSGSTVTRNQDVCTNGATGTGLINSTEGVLYAEIAALANDGTNRAISVNDGTPSNRVSIVFGGGANEIRGQVISSGTSFDFTTTSYNVLNNNKIAISYKLNDFSMWVNGTKVSTDTSGNTPSGMNVINFNAGGTVLPFFGKTKAVAVWKEALSDSELQSLTTI